ncbi:MFS transporter, partial [Paraburkholderia sediminicola]|uniref:MFS transporter n=1 Tax=Paraburkholderia sediminicola TaxID=458836 RepID=UPI0038B7385C
AHLPMLMMSRYNGYRMAGMEMDATMLGGMVAILFGILLSGYGLMPCLPRRQKERGSNSQMHFDAADGAPLNREHWKVLAVLAVALIVDVLKPATLGFVIPDMMREYEISRLAASMLALVALLGTTVGSITWGRLADAFGRRSSILLAALMFIGTSICGAMPTFGWNLAMCFLMGLSAGGLLPITFTVIAETVPASHRGWLLVALGAIGTSGGYLLAAGSAALLVPEFSWRVLWLLGLPTGLLIVFLGHYIPESPRFLWTAGLESEARAVLSRFVGDQASALRTRPEPAAHEAKPLAGSAVKLLRGSHATITWCLVGCGVAWGLVNFGLLLWLPTNLNDLGISEGVTRSLLAHAALLSVPGTAVAILLYYRWSSVKTLVLFTLLTAATLLVLFWLGVTHTRSTTAMALVTASLLIGSTGVISMLIPYASEIYPVQCRGTGTGLIAASSKLGGVLGAGVGAWGGGGHFFASALAIATLLAIAAMLLARCGVETRGRTLDEIQVTFAATKRMREGAA